MIAGGPRNSKPCILVRSLVLFLNNAITFSGTFKRTSDSTSGHCCSHAPHSVCHSSVIGAAGTCGTRIRVKGEYQVSRWEGENSESHLHLEKQTWGLTQHATLECETWTITRRRVVITSQSIEIANHYVVNLKLIRHLYLCFKKFRSCLSNSKLLELLFLLNQYITSIIVFVSLCSSWKLFL